MSLNQGSKYGGNTSSILVEVPEQWVVIDAGSGMMNLNTQLEARFPEYPKGLPCDVSVLVSHLHIDHILGFAFFAPIFDAKTKIYTCSRGDKPIHNQIFDIFSPPYWPVVLGDMVKADVREIFDRQPFKIGSLTVTPFVANHPNITLSYKITDGKKTLIHLLDNEINEMDNEEFEFLVSYCRDADLIVFDAMYSPEDYEREKRGWGHSTVLHGANLAESCGCKRMLFSHFDPKYTDKQLDDLIAGLKPQRTEFFMARDNLCLEI